MKKAFIRTEIIKYLNSLEKENKKDLGIQEVFNILPKLFEHLKSNPENGLGQLDYQQFHQLVMVGYLTAQQKAQFGF